MAEEILHLRAADDVLVPYRSSEGGLVHDRYIGRERVYPFKPIEGGERVAVSARNRSDILRDVRRGHLELIKSAPAPSDASASEKGQD